MSRFYWDIIGGPRYLRYRTPTVAPEPSVKRVARAVHSMGGRIGTHISLRVPAGFSGEAMGLKLPWL
jgi:hypothetical protein